MMLVSSKQTSNVCNAFKIDGNCMILINILFNSDVSLLVKILFCIMMIGHLINEGCLTLFCSSISFTFLQDFVSGDKI